jgi:WD40 repeat protein
MCRVDISQQRSPISPLRARGRARPVEVAPAPGPLTQALDMIASRCLLVTGGSCVRLWTFAGAVLATFHPPAFSPCVRVDRAKQGLMVAAGGVDGKLRLWAVEGRGEPLFEVHHDSPVLLVDLDILSMEVITGSADGAVCRWRLKPGDKQQVQRLSYVKLLALPTHVGLCRYRPSGCAN